jgi:hypothetical protein
LSLRLANLLPRLNIWTQLAHYVTPSMQRNLLFRMELAFIQ